MNFLRYKILESNATTKWLFQQLGSCFQIPADRNDSFEQTVKEKLQSLQQAVLNKSIVFQKKTFHCDKSVLCVVNCSDLGQELLKAR